MLTIGCHLSNAKGFLPMAKEAVKIKANTLQFFTRNPRGSKAKAIDEKDISAFLSFAQDHSIKSFLAHAPYTLNPASSDPKVREFAHITVADDLSRMEYFPGNFYNFHPGSHTGQGIDVGVDLIAKLLNTLMWPEMQTTVLLETMAGKGSEVGSRFEELHQIMDKVELKHKVGVCLDTCHVHDAGYDIVHHLDDVLEEFHRIIGLEHLKFIHLNDSKNPLASHKDRHEVIGGGSIGWESISAIITHKDLRHLPFVLETPNELPGYAKEIELLRECWAKS